MPGILRHDHVDDQCLGRQAAFDQPRWRRGLDHAGRLIGAGLLARATGVLWSPRHDDFEPGRNLVEPFGSILADQVQIATTAGTDLAPRLDHHLLARQVRGKMTAVDFARPSARRCQHRVRLLLRRFAGRDRCLQILQTEIELVLAQALRLAPELIALQLAQCVQQTVVLLHETYPLGGMRRTLGDEHRLQALDVVGQVVGRIRHARTVRCAGSEGTCSICRESTCHRDHCVACGARTRRMWTRAQSRTSNNAESCAGDSRITPSAIAGQRNFAPSSRLVRRHRPV